jgi:hypothetical protein
MPMRCKQKQLNVPIDVRRMRHAHTTNPKARIHQHLRELQTNLGITPSVAHDLAAKRDVAVKSRQRRIAEVAGEVAFLDSKNTTRLQASHHPRQCLGGLVKMAQEEACVDDIEIDKVLRWFRDIGDAIVDVVNILGCRFCTDYLQLSPINVQTDDPS